LGGREAGTPNPPCLNSKQLCPLPSYLILPFHSFVSFLLWVIWIRTHLYLGGEERKCDKACLPFSEVSAQGPLSLYAKITHPTNLNTNKISSPKLNKRCSPILPEQISYPKPMPSLDIEVCIILLQTVSSFQPFRHQILILTRKNCDSG
jgi:hypothetical protein